MAVITYDPIIAFLIYSTSKTRAFKGEDVIVHVSSLAKVKLVASVARQCAACSTLVYSIFLRNVLGSVLEQLGIGRGCAEARSSTPYETTGSEQQTKVSPCWHIRPRLERTIRATSPSNVVLQSGA